MAKFVDIYEAINWFKGTVYDHPEGVGKDTAWSMAGIGADYVGFMKMLGTPIAEKLGVEVSEAAELPVIKAGLLSMMGMANMLGVGDPESGDRFAHGANAFNRVDEALGSTRPPDSWEGSASDAYGEKNKEQRRRAAQMAENDKTVKEVLDREAEQVEKTRETLDHMSTLLTYSVLPALAALAWNTPPGIGEVVSLSIQTAAVTGTLPDCTAQFGRLVSDAAHNATVIRRAGAGYDNIASAARPIDEQ